MMVFRPVSILTVIAACTAVPASHADVVSIGPDRDNTLYYQALGAVSNGAGQYFFVGRTFGALVRRGLVSFDAAGAVPAGSTIVSATLTMHMSRTPSATEIVDLHRVLADWGEGASVAPGEEGGGAQAQTGDATWLHTFWPDQYWATEGGDFDPASSASLSVAGIAFYTWGSTPAMVADVQSWVDSPASNHGWIVLCNEELDGTAKRFDSRQHLDPSVRPVLTIEFRCLADYNGDGFVDGIDSDTFNNDFESQDPQQQMNADVNGDGFVDGIDYDLFNNHFEAGC